MGFTSSPPPDDVARADVKIVLPKDAQRDANGQPTPEVIAQARVVMGETIERLFGQASEAIESQKVRAYIAENAPDNADIASYHAHRVTRDFARLRAARAGAVDRWLSERRTEGDELAKDERAWSRLLEAVEVETKAIVEYAWREEETIPQTMFEGCRIVGAKEHPEEATDEHPEGTVTLSLEAARVIHTNAVAPEAVDGMLRPDARLAERIEAIGKAGHESAERMREAARERWRKHKEHQSAGIPAMIDDGQRFRLGKPFAPAGEAFDESALWALWLCLDDLSYPPWIRATIQAVWLDVVRPTLERERDKPSALVVPIMREVTDFHARGRVFDSDNGQLSFDGREIARMVQTGGRIASVDLSLIQKGLGLLGSRLSHDVLRHEVFEAHRRVLQGETYPNVLTFDGGWSAFAEVLGYSPKKHAIDVRNIVYAQAHFRFTFPDGSKGNMLQYNEKAAIGRHGTARVTLTIGSPLCAGYVHELRESMGKTGLHARQAQRLVPMPRYLPPFHGRANEHGQQASFALALMTELRERAAELAEHGSVRLTHDELTSLADQVALPRKLLVPVLEHWKHDVGDAPAFLRMVDRDRYTLGEAHAAELDFIIEAGRRETRNAALGRASARMRASNARKPRKRGGK
jgi:hypothetical protein